MAKKKKQLTRKQKTFCHEFMKDINATKAAIRAGYSEHTARQVGYRIMTYPHIKSYIAKLKRAREEKCNIDAAWLLKRLADELFADVSDLYNKDMTLKPPHEWPEIWRTGLVLGIDTIQLNEGSGVVSKVRLSDRGRRLELLGKHVDVSAFEEKHVVTGKNGGPVEYTILPVTHKGADDKQN